MISIGEIIQRVRSKIAASVHEDSLRLTSRHIYSILLSGRDLLLSQKSNKKQKISEWNFQTLPSVELERLSEGACEALGIFGCTVLRTKHRLPRPLENLSTELIQSVTSTDESVVFSKISRNSVRYMSGRKYTANTPKYFLSDGHLYLTNPRGAEMVKVVGIFADPLEAHKYPKFCDDCEDCEDCESNLDKDFHIDKQLARTLVELVFAELVGGGQQQKEPQPREQQQEQ